MLKYYCEDAESVLREVGSSEEGLSSGEAAKRLERDGRNELAAEKKDSLIKRFFAQMADPMIIILIAAAAISAITSVFGPEGEGFADVIIILVVVIINAVLGVYQESKAEKAIEALQEMSAATSKVLRDGKMSLLRSDVLVVGDIVILEAGDAVPADGRILESASIKVEEAALTGESVPVYKFIDIIDLKDGPMCPSATARTCATWAPPSSTAAAPWSSPPPAWTPRWARSPTRSRAPSRVRPRCRSSSASSPRSSPGSCSASASSSSPCSILRAGGLNFNVVLDSFMVAVSLAVAAIPEGLAAVVTVVLSIGVTNMSKRNAIIRRLTAVETLGCAQVICSDKTGTLTQNKMTVVDHYGDDEKLLATAMSLCSDAEEDESGIAVGEPTECALVNYAHGLGLGKPALKEAQPRVGEAPFDSMRKMMSTIHKTAQGIVQYTKGAPDEILKLCTSYLDNGAVKPMTDAKRSEILAANKAMADRALRVLAASERLWDSVPADCSPANLEHDLTFIGLTGMIDPVRPEVKAAIEECRSAGIRPIMITGDHIDTAMAIARELGILTRRDPRHHRQPAQ